MRTLLVLAITALSCAAGADEARCRDLVSMTDLDRAIEPGIWMPATEDVPAHCVVRGVINRAIRFEVTLPEDWNDRFMFTAVGGAAGVIGDTRSLLGDGFAMASTDTGHEISEGTTFYKQPEATLDYAFRGVHLATVVAKQVVEHYYANDISYSYLQGCSNGGRAAMLEALRFPGDYDGIIAGAPVFRFEEFVPWALAVYRADQKAPLTKDALRVLDDASRESCDHLDGVRDGVINDPRLCTSEHFDVDSLACRGAARPNCLTKGQIETARVVYGDMRDDDGNVVSPGVPPGAEARGDWAAWQLASEIMDGESIISGIGEMLTLIMRHDPTFDLETFDPVRDRDRIHHAMNAFDVGSFDLSAFADRGGKLLMYQGWNDYPLRPQRAIAYLEGVEAEMGPSETSDFFRLFMVPGMLHCAGGPGAWQADYVKPLMAWRERGEAPERIEAVQPGPIEMAHLVPDERMPDPERFERPLCVYPELAHYDGGDEGESASFSCKVP